MFPDTIICVHLCSAQVYVANTLSVFTHLAATFQVSHSFFFSLLSIVLYIFKTLYVHFLIISLIFKHSPDKLNFTST